MGLGLCHLQSLSCHPNPQVPCLSPMLISTSPKVPDLLLAQSWQSPGTALLLAERMHQDTSFQSCPRELPAGRKFSHFGLWVRQAGEVTSRGAVRSHGVVGGPLETGGELVAQRWEIWAAVL